MSSLWEYGPVGVAEVELVVDVVVEDEVVDVVVDAARASCMLGTIASERTNMRTRRDRDFMKTLQAHSIRY